MKRLFTIFTLLLLAQSCTKETDLSPSGDSLGDPVSFTASVVDMSATRATLINSWSGGEDVALFAGDALYHFTIAEDGTMSGDDVIVNRDESITYAAFYPYDSDFTTTTEYEAACKAGNVDYMSATTVSSDNAVELQFSHTMAALSFTIMIEGTITDPAISLAVDGDFSSAVALEVDASIGSVASKLEANYFVEAGTDISSVMIKLESGSTTTFHSIKREESSSLEAGSQYPFSYTIGDLPVGSGIEGDPYVVYTADDMRKVGTGTDGWNMSSHYILAWDIDLGSEEFTAIGYYNSSSDNSRFTGTFDGDGHEVSGLYINKSTSYQGLFGSTNGATIKNLSVSGSVAGYQFVGGVVGYATSSTVSNCYNTGSVVGADSYVGGVVGYASSTVSECYNTGSVVGSKYYTGGVVGYASSSSSSVSNCYNTGSVVGSSANVGGVVGSITESSSVSDCYNTGSVKGASAYVGGVVGSDGSSSTVNNCYNTGSVEGASQVGGVVGYNNSTSTVSNCYYLSTAYSGNGVGYNDGGTAENVSSKTADEMKATDFVTLLNGEDGTSWMSDYATAINNGYPILTWQTSNN